MNKVISIVIPTFDRQELTDLAVQSVVSSSPELLEIVVVDDCGSMPYSYPQKFNSSGIVVRVLRLPVNVGAGMARRAGVESATGKFVAFLDSDDCYDKGWMDWAIAELRTNPSIHGRRVILAGIALGERPSGTLVRNVLTILPAIAQLPASRLIATLFNPFYTPSILLHKDLCAFRDGLRYCEDYFSTSMALFKADAIFLPSVFACRLGRPPNSAGGLSAAEAKMYRGEMEVRVALLGISCVPFRYKLFMPIGMFYQVARIAIKKLISLTKT